MRTSVALLSILATLVAAQPLPDTVLSDNEHIRRQMPPGGTEAFWRSYEKARVKDLSCSEASSDEDLRLCVYECQGTTNEPEDGVVGYWTTQKDVVSDSPSGTQLYRPWVLKCWDKKDWLQKEQDTIDIYGGSLNKAGIWAAPGVSPREMLSRGLGGITPFYRNAEKDGTDKSSPYSPFYDGSLVAFGINQILYTVDEVSTSFFFRQTVTAFAPY